MAVRFAGAMTALITPFRDGAVDLGALSALAEQQIDAGIDALVPCGTTGEGATLAPDEHSAVVRRVVEVAAGRVPVIAGAGSNNTGTAIELQKRVKEAGADGALQVTPFYNKPNQDGLRAHFEAIVAACPLPTILYNVPGRTSCDLHADTVALLAQNPHIVGIKDATGSAARAQAILRLVDDDFAVLSGEDAFILPLLAMGGHGVISVVSHVKPRAVSGLIDAHADGDLALARSLARELVPFAELMFVDTNPLPVKTACAALGLCREEFRLPLVPLRAEARAALLDGLREHGLSLP